VTAVGRGDDLRAKLEALPQAAAAAHG
jgi:hypothetical protein